MGLILVVSEDAIEIETIKAALSVHGWWVTVAGDRRAALQVAADQAPKLVIVDSEVDESIELVKSFGAGNGGPGALVCGPEDVEAPLAHREAGADETLTKPLEASRLLEAVQRCLSAPRQQPAERAPAAAELLTSQEIFGDVLRELEEEGIAAEDELESAAPPATVPPSIPAVPEPIPAQAEPVAPPPAADPAPPAVPPAPLAQAPVGQVLEPSAPPSPPAPPVPAAADPAQSPPAGTDQGQPVVSLAGLFDGEPMGDLPQTSTASTAVQPEPRAEDLDSLWGAEKPGTPVPEATSSPSAPNPEEWQGEERRGTERPWTAPSGEESPTADEPPADSAEPVPSVSAYEPPETGGEETVEEDAPAPEEPITAGPRVPRQAIVIGSIAAALLIVVGVIFFRNPGADAADPADLGEVLVPVEEEFTSEELTAEPAEEAPAEPVAVAGAPAVAEQPSPAEPIADEEPMEDLDLQAIVDQELERREEELRQVFLEEERRLLRELGNLDPGEEGESSDDGDGDETGGAGASV